MTVSRRAVDWSVVVVDLRMALRNVFRHKARTALTLSIIGVGVAGMILSGGFVEYSLRALRESTIHAQLGHLQIYRAGYYLHGRRSPYEYLIEDPATPIAATVGEPAVKAVMSRLAFSGMLNNGRADYAIQGEGIEPRPEAKLGTQIQLIDGRALEPTDRFGMMVGEGVAASAGLKAGSTVNLLLNTRDGALNSLEFTVVGVFRTFSRDYDARAVRIALPDAQALLDSPAINAIVVELAATSSTDAVAARLRERLGSGYEIKTWLELADFYEKTAALFKRQFAFLQAIILLSVLLSVANSVNMTIFERTGEFGTLMAVGTRRAPLFRLLVIENAFVGLFGSLVGVVLGVVVGNVVNALHIAMPPPPNANSGYFAGVTLDFALVATSFVVGFVATPLTALLPARRIARVPVVEALRMN